MSTEGGVEPLCEGAVLDSGGNGCPSEQERGAGGNGCPSEQERGAMGRCHSD